MHISDLIVAAHLVQVQVNFTDSGRRQGELPDQADVKASDEFQANLDTPLPAFVFVNGKADPISSRLDLF